MTPDFGDKLSAKFREPPLSPLETARAFLRAYASDSDSMAEIHAVVARTATGNPRKLVSTVEAIEALLANPPSAGDLARLVAWDGNFVLADPSDVGARAWLLDLAAYIRKVLEDQPPRRTTDAS